VAIYYPPPGPHVGGRQPYDNKDLSPTVEAVQVDSPPFGMRRQFDPAWWGTYTLQYVYESSPGIFSITQVDSPPFGIRQIQSYLPWLGVYIVPQVAGKLSPSLLNVLVDNPPFSKNSQLRGVHAAWWEPPPAAQQRVDVDMSVGIPGQSVDDPP